MSSPEDAQIAVDRMARVRSLRDGATMYEQRAHKLIVEADVFRKLADRLQKTALGETEAK